MAVLAVTVLIIGALSSARIEPFEEALGRGYSYVVTDGVYGIIIDDAYVPRQVNANRDDIDGFWTPTAEDIARAEELLLEVRGSDREDTLSRRREDPGLTAREAVDALVTRKYFGVVSEGRNLLMIEGFCSGGTPANPLMRTRVEDGGPCYWSATIDADAWTIESYFENGYA